jgi:hypothetical protein
MPVRVEVGGSQERALLPGNAQIKFGSRCDREAPRHSPGIRSTARSACRLVLANTCLSVPGSGIGPRSPARSPAFPGKRHHYGFTRARHDGDTCTVVANKQPIRHGLASVGLHRQGPLLGSSAGLT